MFETPQNIFSLSSGSVQNLLKTYFLSEPSGTTPLTTSSEVELQCTETVHLRGLKRSNGCKRPASTGPVLGPSGGLDSGP